MFSENNTWAESKVFFPDQIKNRLLRPRSRKDPWLTSRDLVREGDKLTWVRRRITEVEEEEQSSTPSTVQNSSPGTAEVSKAPAMPSVEEREASANLTPDILPLSSPPPAAPSTSASTHSASSSPPALSPEPAVQRVPIKKRKATAEMERTAKRRKDVKIPVINLDVDEKLKEMEEVAEKEGDHQKLKDIAFVKKGLMWIGETDGEECKYRTYKTLDITL